MKAREILVAAKAMCTPGQWAQGESIIGGTLPEGKICAGMAIDQAMCELGVSTHYTDALKRRVSGVDSSTGIWNDSHTYEEVMAAFDHAIGLCDLEMTHGD